MPILLPKQSRLRAAVTGFAVLAVAAGCSKQSSPAKVHVARQADARIEASFDVAREFTLPDANTDVSDVWASLNGNRITLKKAALGKAFLLSPTMVVAQNQPIIDHLAPKVVSFERNGTQLALFELNAASVYDNLPSDKLLETFDVTDETADSIVFQWSYGLSAVPLTGLFTTGASDFPSETGDSGQAPIMPANKTFVRKAQFDHNQLEIEQVSEVIVQNIPLDLGSLTTAFTSGSGLTQNYKSVSVKLDVSLRPYLSNPGYQRRQSPFFKGIGAFEVAQTRKGDGKVDFLATSWDLSDPNKPLVYAATKATPKEYLDAIREGILYWNKVAGREIIRFESDADPNAFPEERKVLVHWIPWDQAGFARASMQADPLTGELLRADVYLTSAFANGAAMRMRSVLKTYNTNTTSYAVLPASFQPATICQYDRPFEYLGAKEPAVVNAYIHDTLREVVAHEVGHTLGLRHNFAGSLHTEFKDMAAEELAETRYMKGELAGGAEVSSSVMDYIFGIPNGLLGAYIKDHALAYDTKFVEWFYNKEFDLEKATIPPFCSDGLGDKLPGCVRGDIGLNTVRDARNRIHDRVRSLENAALHGIVMKLHPKNPLDRMPLSQLESSLAAVNVDSVAKGAAADLGAIRSLLSDGAQDYAVELNVGRRSWANEAAYNLAMQSKIKTELDSVGGALGLINTLYPLSASGTPVRGWLKKHLLEIYSRPDFKKGTSLEGVAYELTPQEDAFIGRLVEAYADKAEEAWLNAVLAMFSFGGESDQSGGGLGSIFSSLGSDTKRIIAVYSQQEVWWPQLAKIAESVITARDGLVVGNVNGSSVDLPKPVYNKATRKQMIAFAVPENYRLHSPEKANLANARTQIFADISKALGKDLKETSALNTQVKTLQLDASAKRWLDEEIATLKDLDSKL